MLRLLLPFFCAGLVWLVILILVIDIVVWGRRLLHNIHRNLAIPCHRCRYANANPLLKCAVRPQTAFTEQALQCHDYHSLPPAMR